MWALACFFSLGSQYMGWCYPHLKWVLPPSLSESRNSSIGLPRDLTFRQFQILPNRQPILMTAERSYLTPAPRAMTSRSLAALQFTDVPLKTWPAGL